MLLTHWTLIFVALFDITCTKDLELGGFGSCVNMNNNPLFKEKKEAGDKYLDLNNCFHILYGCIVNYMDFYIYR